MKHIKKIGSFLQNCVELYIPAISFAVLFVLKKRQGEAAVQ